MPAPIVVCALLAIGLAAVTLLWRVRVASAQRGQVLASCEAVLTDPVRRGERNGYGSLSGRFEGVPVALSLIPEALVFRRLPQLWLGVSVHLPTGASATLDVVRRATNAEFYAPASELPVRYAVPATWPAETLVRGSHDALPLVERVGRPVAGILADPRVKEVLVTPRGVRIVTQACEGERGAYLLMRGHRFALDSVDPDRLRELLTQALSLARDTIDEPCTTAAA